MAQQPGDTGPAVKTAITDIRQVAVSPRPARSRPLRYVLVGAASAVAHNVIMIGGDRLGGHYAPLTFLSFASVTPFAFWMHSRFTFGAPLSWHNLMRFSSGVAAGFPLSLGTMAVLCSGFNLSVTIAAPIATLVLFAWNYVSAHVAILGRLRLR